MSRRRPVLLVLEDAHWADVPTLSLLRHLGRAGGRARVLLLATFRETEAGDALSDALADLRRSEDVVRLRLEGLTGEEVAEFVRQASGGDGADLAQAISELTSGNPFLVCELWRSLADTGELGTPESVREVVGQRLARLRPATSDLLELAATAGAEFDLETLGLAAAVPEAELLSALDEAVRSGMIEELPSRRLAYRFTHELFRRALYDRLTGLRRAELHLRFGEALERSGGGRDVAELAYHFAAAAPFGGTARGVEYNVLAARAAAAALDFDDAAERLRVALELGVQEPLERGELLLELGGAGHRGGRLVDALAAFTEAAEIGRATGDADLLARAAIGYEETCWRPVITDRVAVELLEEAALALGDEASEVRVGVLGGLARALQIRGRHERGAAVREEAVTMARALGARAALATVLVGSYWSRETMSSQQVLERLNEARDIADELGDVELRSEAMNWRVSSLVAACDLVSARREIEEVRETAERTAQPFHVHVAEHCGSAIALCEGRLADAEAMAMRSNEWSRLLTGRDASGVHGIQMFSVRREQGRLAELAPLVRLLATQGQWRPGLAALLAELGMETEARAELRASASDGLDEFRASLWLASLTYLTDACAALGDEETAALVYGELAPFGGGNVMIGHVVACYGAADRYLGMLAATLGEWERAELHFERAMALNRRMGAADVGRAHRVRARADAAPPRRSAPRAGRRAARRGGHAGRADRHAGVVESRARAVVAAPGVAGRSVGARGGDPRPRRPGPVQPRDRREAVHQRAHRREPHPQHPAQDQLREPHRGRVLRPPARVGRGGGSPVGSADHAVLRDRTRIRQGAQPHERRRPADRRDQCRRGRPLGVLLPHRRQAAHLLPLRGALTGSDTRRRGARERSRGRDRRGQRARVAGAAAADARMGRGPGGALTR